MLFPPSALLAEALGGETQLLPTRRVDIDGKSFSTVLRGSSVCHPNAPLDFHTLAASHRGATADKREVCLNPEPEADPRHNPASDPNSDPKTTEGVCHPCAPLGFHTLGASHRGASAGVRHVRLNTQLVW